MVPVYSRNKYFLKKLSEIWILTFLPSLLCLTLLTLKKTLKTLDHKSLTCNSGKLLAFLGLQLSGSAAMFWSSWWPSSKAARHFSHEKTKETELPLAHILPMCELGEKYSSWAWTQLHAKACSLVSRAWLGFDTTQPASWLPCGNLTTTRGLQMMPTEAQSTCGGATGKMWKALFPLKGSFSSETHCKLWNRIGPREAHYRSTRQTQCVSWKDPKVAVSSKLERWVSCSARRMQGKIRCSIVTEQKKWNAQKCLSFQKQLRKFCSDTCTYKLLYYLNF